MTVDAPRTSQLPRAHRKAAQLHILDRLATPRVLTTLVSLSLVAAPVMALLHYQPGWVPEGDNAFIGLRAYDVGTARTPLTGQPSFSSIYGGDTIPVDHPGALHFYLLAPAVRLFGASMGLMLVSAVVAAGTAVFVTWVACRRLGTPAAAFAAILMAAIMFTSGAAPLVNPLSSSFAGYPLLAAAVAVWAVLCGDLRLMPVAIACGSLALQSHLAAGLATTAVLITLVAGVAVCWRRARARDDTEVLLRLSRMSASSAMLAAVLWAPPLMQQVFGNTPNLSALLTFASDSDVESLGTRAGLHGLVNVLGWPPFLGRLQLGGRDVIATPSLITWLSAVAVAAIICSSAVRWARAARSDRTAGADGTALPGRTRPRFLLTVMVGVMAIAGFLTATRVPKGWEVNKLAFYHWIWPLLWFASLALWLTAWDARHLVTRWAPNALREPWTRSAGAVRQAGRAAATVAVACIIVTFSVLNVTIDRRSNSLTPVQTVLPAGAYRSLATQVIAEQDRIDGPVILMTTGQALLAGAHSAMALQLEEAGLPVVHPYSRAGYVADGRIANYDAVDTALVLALQFRPNPENVQLQTFGEAIAHYSAVPGFNSSTYARLVHQLEGDGDGDDLEYGPGWQRYLDLLPSDERALAAISAARLWNDAPTHLMDPGVCDLLLSYPPTNRDLNPVLLERHCQEIGLLPSDGRAYEATVLLITNEHDLDRLLDRTPGS